MLFRSEAQQWDGWGTALSPSHEPIVLARKPLEKGLTVAQNVLKWGTGALNIDGCRIIGDVPARKDPNNGNLVNAHMEMRPWMQKRIEEGLPLKGDFEGNPSGRWPSNLLLANVPSVLGLFPTSSTTGVRSEASRYATVGGTSILTDNHQTTEYTDSGSTSRYFFRADLLPVEEEELNLPIHVKAYYCAKPSKVERNLGKTTDDQHCTVKPVALMHHLVTIVTPPKGICCDPFLGSGSTGVAARLAGVFGFVGMEQEEPSMKMAQDRIDNYWRYLGVLENHRKKLKKK